VLNRLRGRQHRLEERLERRFPKIYDARHAAQGIVRALGPLIFPLLAALVLVPLLALLAAIVAWLGIKAPSIDLPDVDLPSVPLPDLDAPGWLEAVGRAIEAVLEVLGAVSRYAVPAVFVLIGLKRTRDQRRRRAAAEATSRQELLQRLAVILAAVEADARARGATSVRARHRTR